VPNTLQAAALVPVLVHPLGITPVVGKVSLMRSTASNDEHIIKKTRIDADFMISSFSMNLLCLHSGYMAKTVKDKITPVKMMYPDGHERFPVA